MSTLTSRARVLRGALVGVCSVVLTLAAHSVGGGGLPGGGAFALVLVLCAGMGVASSALEVSGRLAPLVASMAALAAGQLMGHLTLAAGAHHGVASVGVRMLAAHAVATVVLGLLIALAEYLFVVGESVLGWLRLISVLRTRVLGTVVPRYANPVVVESVLLRAGLGMRAPPVRSFAA